MRASLAHLFVLNVNASKSLAYLFICLNREHKSRLFIWFFLRLLKWSFEWSNPSNWTGHNSKAQSNLRKASFIFGSIHSSYSKHLRTSQNNVGNIFVIPVSAEDQNLWNLSHRPFSLMVVLRSFASQSFGNLISEIVLTSSYIFEKFPEVGIVNYERTPVFSAHLFF